jgi:hypothetical protein
LRTKRNIYNNHEQHIFFSIGSKSRIQFIISFIDGKCEYLEDPSDTIGKALNYHKQFQRRLKVLAGNGLH